MATIKDRLKSVASYVETYTGRETLLEDSGFVQKIDAYATVKLIANVSYQHDTKMDIDGLNEEVRGLRKLSYSIRAIGGEADDDLHRLKSSFDADVPLRSLTDQGIGVLVIGDVTDTSLVVAGRIEERAVLTITLSASVPEIFDFESATEAQVEVDPGLTPTENLIIPTDTPDCPV
jgi:hypothetical protein